MLLFLTPQHGRRDVTCKLAIGQPKDSEGPGYYQEGVSIQTTQVYEGDTNNFFMPYSSFCPLYFI